MKMNEYRKVQMYIEVRTHAGRMCYVFVYKPRYALGRFTKKDVKQGTVVL